MQKLAVIDKFSIEAHVSPIMLQLGPEWVTYYCDSKSLHSNLSQGNFVKKLLAANIEVVIDNYKKALSHPAILVDSEYFAIGDGTISWPKGDTTPLASAIHSSGMKIIRYDHSTDSLQFWPAVEGFWLYSSEMQFFENVGHGTYMLDEKDRPVWGMSAKGGEGVNTGLLHMGEWLTKRETDKATLKAELAEQMQVAFDPALPLLVYYTSEYVLDREIDAGLMRLSEHANIVIKKYRSLSTYGQGKNIHIYPDDRHSGVFLPRFAADAVLAGYGSGTLTTSIMLGLRTIPVFTQHVDRLGLGGKDVPNIDFYRKRASSLKQRFTSFTNFLVKPHSLICRHITPLNIMATEMLLQRVHDAAYWEAYDANIQHVAQNIFGECRLDGHILAAEYIKNVVQYGTLLPKDIAVLNKCWEGKPEVVADASCQILL